MIRKLTLSHFQSIRETVELDFRPLTFLYGPNAVGKSAIADALELLEALTRRDPLVGPMLEQSTRDSYFSLTEEGIDQIGMNEEPTLSLTAFVDGSMLNQMQDKSLLEATFPDLHGLLIDGADIGITVNFGRHGGRNPHMMALSVDGHELLRYTHESIEYDEAYQFCDTPAVSRRWLDGKIALNKQTPATPGFADLRTPLPGRRGQLICQEQDDVIALRGLELVLYGAPVSVCISESAEMVCFPRDGRMSPLAPTMPAVLSTDNSIVLFTRLRSAAKLLSDFIEIFFQAVNISLQILRVRGNRAPASSDRPLHLKSRVDAYYEDKADSPWSGLYDGPRPLGQHFGSKAYPEDRLLERYVKQLNCPVQHTEQVIDFPNFALKHYLHSLSRFRFSTDTYCIVDMESAENPGEFLLLDQSRDPGRLAGSLLVYFSVREKPVGNRSFSQVGSSLGYVFPVLIALGEEASSFIEEPELHLHPRAQEELADCFLHAKASLGKRIVIESHSEAFLIRVSKRIKETFARSACPDVVEVGAAKNLSVTPAEVSIYVFERSQSGSLKAHQVLFAPDGSLLDDWPEAGFDQTWSAVIGRLSLFSKNKHLSEAQEEWPWLIGIAQADPLMEKWLIFGWQYRKLGQQLHEFEIVNIAKIVERALGIRFLDAMLEVASEPSFGLDQAWTVEFFKWKKEGSFPLLWWEKTLIKLKLPSTRNDKRCISKLREVIASADWQAAWNAYFKEGDLIAEIHALRNLRNQCAHASGRTPKVEALDAIRGLVYDGNQPGRLLVALGFAIPPVWQKPISVK